MEVEEERKWPEWMSIQTVMEYTDYSRDTIKRWISDPYGAPQSRHEGRMRRFKKSEIDAWMDAHTNSYERPGQLGLERYAS